MKITGENKKHYDVWDMNITDISSRSIFYNLPPIGIGTVDVESLTGYISRLAREHSLSPVILLKNSVHDRSLLPSCILDNSISASLAGSLNGFGKATVTLIKILKEATRREDLHYTCLTQLEGIISNHKLLKKNLAWCPVCYEEQMEKNGIVYEKLIWTFNDIKACHVHELPLVDCCRHCRRKLKVLSGKSNPGFCSKCRKWLGGKSALFDELRHFDNENEKRIELWKAAKLGELLLKVPFLLFRQESFSANLQLLINSFSGASINNFAHKVEIWHISIRRLLEGKVLPTMGILLKLCYELKLPVEDLLKDREPVEPANEPVKISEKPFGKAEMLPYMQIFLTESPPPSANEIERRSSWTTERLKRNFPEEYKRIIRRYNDHLKQGTSKIPDEDVERILSESLKKKIPPSLQSIFRDIGCSNTGYRYYQLFPELCAKISGRYKKSRHKKFNLPRAARIINLALEEDPPPSFSEVARRIKCTREHLRKKLPVPAASLNDRYETYLVEYRKENSNLLREAIKKVLLELSTKNLPISINRVRQLLPRKWNEANFKSAYQLIAKELGINTEK